MVAAVGSWLDARARGGKWFVRIDDVDPPRVAPGSIDSILRTLEGFGLTWDGSVVFQSAQSDAYRAAVEHLQERGLTFGCACTRKDLGGAQVYPGTCREAAHVNPRSLRFKSPGGIISWNDGGMGTMEVDSAKEVGDFLLRNAHGIYSYHLANVVDDMAMDITHVVRGADLAAFTPAHLQLHAALGGAAIAYQHLPLARDAEGNKLSKQTLAPAVQVEEATDVLHQVCAHLGLAGTEGDDAPSVLASALAAWKAKLG